MAGEWIKMRTNLWDDPRIARLCDLTDQSEAAVIGGLYWLWAMADEHTEDGILPGLTTKAIDRKTGVPGIGAALCDVGWLADHPEGVRIVGFEEHNGTSAKRRCTDAQAKANKRKASEEAPEAVREMSARDADNAPTNNGQKTDNCGAREEKRREEKNSPSLRSGEGAARGKRKPANTPIPDGFAISDRVTAWAIEKGHDNLPLHLEAFKAKVAAKGYQYVDWDSAFMEAIREDWAKLRGANGARASPYTPINRQEALEARNRAVADEWLREQGVSDAGIGQVEILDASH